MDASTTEPDSRPDYLQSPYLQFGATPAEVGDPETAERFAYALTILEAITDHFAEFGPWEEKTPHDLLDELNHHNGWALADGILQEGEEITLTELLALSRRRNQALEELGWQPARQEPLIRFMDELIVQAVNAEAELAQLTSDLNRQLTYQRHLAALPQEELVEEGAEEDLELEAAGGCRVCASGTPCQIRMDEDVSDILLAAGLPASENLSVQKWMIAGDYSSLTHSIVEMAEAFMLDRRPPAAPAIADPAESSEPPTQPAKTGQPLIANTVEAYASEFKRILNGFSHKRNIRELFTDWLEIAACTMHNAPYQFGLPKDEDFEKVEARYMEAIQKYEREELDAFAKMLGLTQMALQTSKTDFLGKLYMELEISQDRSGEFFTPFPLSLATASMMLGDVAELIEEKGYITVAEPTCGAGGMLIAAAQIVEAAGYHPGAVMFFDATDISKACCDMTYIQTSILKMSGIVRHGNSLSQDTWDERLTPTYRVILAQARQQQSDQPASDTTTTGQAATDGQSESPLESDEAAPTPEADTTIDELIHLANDTEGYEQGRLF